MDLQRRRRRRTRPRRGGAVAAAATPRRVCRSDCRRPSSGVIVGQPPPAPSGGRACCSSSGAPVAGVDRPLVGTSGVGRAAAAHRPCAAAAASLPLGPIDQLAAASASACSVVVAARRPASLVGRPAARGWSGRSSGTCCAAWRAVGCRAGRSPGSGLPASSDGRSRRPVGRHLERAGRRSDSGRSSAARGRPRPGRAAASGRGCAGR